jgi:hypothetical protein
MTDFENYIKGILQQILNSYQILDKLKDKPGELEIIKIELSKINGLIQVVVNKLDLSKNSSNDFVKLLSASKYFIENYDFLREIESISKLYSDDPSRLKNLRFTILNALNDKKLIDKIESILSKS